MAIVIEFAFQSTWHLFGVVFGLLVVLAFAGYLIKRAFADQDRFISFEDLEKESRRLAGTNDKQLYVGYFPKEVAEEEPPRSSYQVRPAHAVPTFRRTADTAPATRSAPAASGYRAKRVDSGTQVRMDSDADTQESRGKNSAQH